MSKYVLLRGYAPSLCASEKSNAKLEGSTLDTTASRSSTTPLFTSRDLRALFIPLVLERLLSITVGMADTVMVSAAGEAAVSGISLVDQLNILLIQVFAALATGGTVVASQYLGRRDEERACITGKLLVHVSFLISLVVTIPSLLFGRHILSAVFGQVDPAVMDAAAVYFVLSALSYPVLALYNTGAALFRSMGQSKAPLYVSLIMNVINIIGNAILIYGLHWGVAGAGISTLLSRVVAGITIILLLYDKRHPLCLSGLFRIKWNGKILRSIFRISIPNGIESGMFQAGKLLVASLISSFGTAAIAANAVMGNVSGLCDLPGSAISLGIITVVGQCVGAGDHLQARHYTKKLLLTAHLCVGVTSAAVFLALPYIVKIYGISPEAMALALLIGRLNCVMSTLSWPSAFTLPAALRGAGDAKYVLMVSLFSMVVFRIGLSYAFAYFFHMGLLGVWTAMFVDWIVRAAAFWIRFHGKKWESIRII